MNVWRNIVLSCSIILFIIGLFKFSISSASDVQNSTLFGFENELTLQQRELILDREMLESEFFGLFPDTLSVALIDPKGSNDAPDIYVNSLKDANEYIEINNNSIYWISSNNVGKVSIRDQSSPSIFQMRVLVKDENAYRDIEVWAESNNISIYKKQRLDSTITNYLQTQDGLVYILSIIFYVIINICMVVHKFKGSHSLFYNNSNWFGFWRFAILELNKIFIHVFLLLVIVELFFVLVVVPNNFITYLSQSIIFQSFLQMLYVQVVIICLGSIVILFTVIDIFQVRAIKAYKNMIILAQSIIAVNIFFALVQFEYEYNRLQDDTILRNIWGKSNYSTIVSSLPIQSEPFDGSSPDNTINTTGKKVFKELEKNNLFGFASDLINEGEFTPDHIYDGVIIANSQYLKDTGYCNDDCSKMNLKQISFNSLNSKMKELLNNVFNDFGYGDINTYTFPNMYTIHENNYYLNNNYAGQTKEEYSKPLIIVTDRPADILRVDQYLGWLFSSKRLYFTDSNRAQSIIKKYYSDYDVEMELISNLVQENYQHQLNVINGYIYLLIIALTIFFISLTIYSLVLVDLIRDEFNIRIYNGYSINYLLLELLIPVFVFMVLVFIVVFESHIFIYVPFSENYIQSAVYLAMQLLIAYVITKWICLRILFSDRIEYDLFG